MGKLTVLQIKNLKEPGRLGDGQGLFFELTDTGIKRWLYRYKIAGKSGVYIIGRYPDMSLEQARKAHRQARDLVKQGLNPAKARKRERRKKIIDEEAEKRKKDNSFKAVAIEWYELARQGKHRANAKPWTERHSKTVLSSMERDVFPVVGDIPIDEIEPADLMRILDRMTGRGVYDNTRKVFQRINLIFNYAIVKLKCTVNPSAPLQGLLPTGENKKHHPALFDKDLGQLMKDISACEKMHMSTKLALRFAAYTALRSGEVRLATWDEVDPDACELHISSERMKRGRPHIAPLSTQAMVILDMAGEFWGKEGLIFPSPLGKGKALSDGTLSKALRSLGYRDRAVVHGLRASFSTMANEYTDFERVVIETSMSHVIKDKTEAAYNHSRYLAKRHKLMQWWGDKLHELEFNE